MEKRGKKAQISFEYLIIMGFLTFVIIGILSVAFFYSNGIKDRIKVSQMNNFANKIISTSESVFYAGYPSKATINCYLPEGVKEVYIPPTNDTLIISIELSSGLTRTAFSSNVPISGSLTTNHGLKKIEIKAEEDKVVISQV